MALMGNAVFAVVWFRGDFQGDFEARRELMTFMELFPKKTKNASNPPSFSTWSFHFRNARKPVHLTLRLR